MSIKIRKPTEPIELKNIIMCITGLPDTGKTSLAFTAKNPLLLDFDKGLYRAQNIGASVSISKWDMVTSIDEDDLKDYDTIIIDTVGEMIEAVKTSLGGVMNQHKWTILSSTFISFVNKLQSYEKDIVLICHGTEGKKGENDIIRIDVEGKSKNKIYKMCDAMGNISKISDKRVLSFDSSSESIGKNFAEIEAQNIPHYNDNKTFLATIIDQIKDAVRKKSEAMINADAAINAVKLLIDGIEDVSSLNAYKQHPEVVDSLVLKRHLMAQAEKIGCIFDKDKKEFALKPEEVKNEKLEG